MKSRWLRCVAIFLLILTAASCSLKSDDTAFLTDLDSVDILIRQGDTAFAIKKLKKIEKKAFNVYASLGILRRYIQLGENAEAERFILSVMKKKKDSTELNAIYAYLLLRNGKTDQALPFAKKLSGTMYDSLYSEALLTKTHSEKKELKDYLDESFVPVFEAAYKTSANTSWIKNCALISIKSDNIKDSGKYQPQKLFTADDAYFWGLVQYDSSNFLQAAQDFALAQNLLSVSLRKDRDSILAGISALKADAMINIGEYEAAEKEREFLLSLITDTKNLDFLPVTYVNSAFWAAQKGDIKTQYDMLFKSVKEFPDYIPGLASYANLAWEQNQPSESNFYETALRNSGMKTLEMQKYDRIPKASTADALFRMSQALEKNPDPMLLVIKKDFENKVNNIPVNKKIADVWKILESNSLNHEYCPPVIVHYALDTFLGVEQEDEAESVFTKYIVKRYDFSDDENLFVQFTDKVNEFDGWECEYAAYFALKHKYIDIARELYESLSKRRPEYSAERTADFSYSPVMNLAVIYSSIGKKKDAVDLYSVKAGSVYNKVRKAEILYRIACIQNMQNKSTDALKTLDYAVSLNPLHEKAHLLQLQLKNNK